MSSRLALKMPMLRYPRGLSRNLISCWGTFLIASVITKLLNDSPGKLWDSRNKHQQTNVFARSQQAKHVAWKHSNDMILFVFPMNHPSLSAHSWASILTDLQVPYTMRQALSSRSDVQASLKANHWRFPATSYVDVLRWLELGGGKRQKTTAATVMTYVK